MNKPSFAKRKNENLFPEVMPQRHEEVEKEMKGQKGIPEARGSDTSSIKSEKKEYSWRVRAVLRDRAVMPRSRQTWKPKI